GRIEIEKSGAVRLDYRCTDDQGIGEVFLEYQSGGSRHRRQIATSSTGRKSINSQYEWVVPGSGGRLSKKLALRIGARDKDNISGPKTGYSRTITVHLVTDEMRHRRILARQEQLKRRMVNLLADELIFATAPLKPGKNLTADQAVLRSLHDIMLLNQLILREMRGDPLVDQTFYDELTSMLERRESENAALRKALRESRRVPPAGRKNEESREANISQVVREIVPPLEDDIIQLDDLLEMAHLRSARRMAERMAKMQQELAELIRKMKEGGLTAEELQQIKQRIAAMKRMMDELSRRLAMSARKIEREFMNPDALQTLGMREELAEKLDHLQEMAEKGRLDEALSEAEKLSQQLQNMMQGLSQSGQRLAAARMSPYLRKLRKFQQDLNRIREEQADLRDATSAIRRKMREEIVRNEAGDLESFTKKQLKRAEQISQEIEKVLERARNTPDLEQYRTLRQKLRNKLREMATAEGEGPVNRLPEKLSGELEDITSQMRSLKRGDAADSILSGAEKAKDEVKQLKKSLENYDFQKALKRANNTRREMQEWGNICKRAGSPREMTQHTSSAADTAAKISNDIRKMAEKIQKAGRSGASGAHGKSAQVIGGRQRQTLQKLRDARGQKGRVGNQEMKNALDQADRHMDSATAGLSKRHIGRPLEDQQAALEQLDRAIQEGKGKIQQMQQNMQGRAARMAGGRAGREGRSGAGRDRVQIPDPSAYRVPEEFREQIQKALSDGLPSDHREANERYFEDLVE
ncbi:MAG: hypothetical protein KGZ25_11830, partial [Planctomycetes bacterium]|nr:hypothetical protein [Planctomycetota bacterium]